MGAGELSPKVSRYKTISLFWKCINISVKNFCEHSPACTLLYEAGKHWCRDHRVGVALVTIAAALIGLTFAQAVQFALMQMAGETLSPITASNSCSRALESLDLNELGELRSAKCIVHVLLLATGARAIRAAEGGEELHSL
jgi:hypothetical protein